MESDVNKWIEKTKKEIIGKEITACICHSLGGTLAMNMISQGLLKVKYLMTLGSSFGPKDDELMDAFLMPPIKISKLKKLKKFYAISSYDDPATNPEYSTLLVKQANVIGIFYKDKGHFINRTKLPEEVMDLISKFIINTQ